ncbi:MAG: aquaporin family protein [Rhabdochlamydiaceae bacterium]|nr:aquaporin family protein [Candidatus Amphrikana amoebophyrae]
MNILIAEFLGTLLLVLLGNGSVANVLFKGSKGIGGGWIVISFAWGFAVTVGVYVCGWVSGGHINPAVTISMAVIGKTAWNLVPYYLVGQFVGAYVGAMLVYVCYYCHYQAEENVDYKRLSFCTYPAIVKLPINFLTEVIATFVLIFGILGMINAHLNLPADISPYMFGILVTSIGLSLGGPTGYAINPARDWGPRLAHSTLFSFKNSQWDYAWIPMIGPLVGGVSAALLYKALFS